LADKWQQYLRQQIELGGGEIYVAEAGQLGSGAGRQEAINAAVTAPRSGSPAAPPAAVAWQKGAPPIPGPGLTIQPPVPNLLSRDLDHMVSLEGLAARVATCTLCGLSKSRHKTVPGEGSSTARLMLVGEGPGATEDQTGRPFVGAAGELLTQILGSIGIPRESVFIANIVKCRPPENRKPLPDESAACLPYLHRQVQLVNPKVLVALGATAAEGLLGVRQSLGNLRGSVHSFWGIPLVVTYHPAALLRNPNWKKPTWDDVRIARQLLDR
jgi:DNA polymerase